MSKFFKVALPVILIVGAFTSVYLFIKFKKVPPRREVRYEGPLVTVETAHLAQKPVVIEGFGTVKPEHTLDLVPQVSGKVMALSENFIDGGFVKKGEVLVQLERSDYEIALNEDGLPKLRISSYYKDVLSNKASLPESASVWQ